LEDFIRKNGLEKDKDLKLLKNAVGNLTKDIVNFFDMEKIQKGIDMYDHHQISNFSELLDNSIQLFRVIAAKKQIKITTSITDNLLVMADPSSVIRIINNLIENAIKYTNPEGEIIIKLYEGNNNIYFSVKDNGIGISDSFRNKVFEPYFQINSEKSNFQGMGLGLSIVKKITGELAGKIELYSDPGKSPGTEMIIQLPRSESKVTGWSVEQFVQPAEIDVVTIPDQVFDEDKYTIMVVEDNIALLNYIVTKLQENYNVYFARNGQEAIHKIKTLLQLDLIISDVMMDDGDGFYLYQHLNASKKFNHLPLLFLTAKQETETRIKGLSMGAIDYISKPFVIDELDRKINSILTNRINYRNAIVTQAYNAISNTRIRNLSDGSDSFDENCTKYKLTPREMEVIQLMADGKITKEIASLLNISVDTVKKHIRNSYEKTGVNCKFELLKKLSH
ncbi:MAG TPA: ATP-binding protein, partial [Bacteroidia bacterium]|nr:ATP-binding protein [Bacteroidia bacterium]